MRFGPNLFGFGRFPTKSHTEALYKDPIVNNRKIIENLKFRDPKTKLPTDLPLRQRARFPRFVGRKQVITTCIDQILDAL